MAWEHRNKSGPYYYRSERTQNGVRKVYLGRGEKAHQETLRMAKLKAEEKAEKLALQAEQQKTSQAKQLTADLDEFCTLLLEASLFAAGYWRGRDYRKWRKCRGIKG